MRYPVSGASPYTAIYQSSPNGVGGGLSGWVQGLFWVASAMSLVATTTSLMAKNAFEDAASPTSGFGTWSSYVAADGLFALTNVAFLGVSIALLVLLIIWTWQGHRAVEWLSPGKRRWSSGWAIGGWFVPFASLVIPKQLIDDTERIAGAPRWQGRAVEWKSTKSSPVGKWWWGLWILSNLVLGWARVQNTGPDSLMGAGDVTRYYSMWAIGYVVAAASAACGALFVRKLSRRLTSAALLQPGYLDSGAAGAFGPAGPVHTGGPLGQTEAPWAPAAPEPAWSPLPDAPWAEDTNTAMARCEICTDLLPATASRCPRCGKDRQPTAGTQPSRPPATPAGHGGLPDAGPAARPARFSFAGPAFSGAAGVPVGATGSWAPPLPPPPASPTRGLPQVPSRRRRRARRHPLRHRLPPRRREPPG